MDQDVKSKYFYNFEFMGVPVIQYPNDLIQIQEIIWNTKPSVIIETGLAWGGLHLFMANCLNMLKWENERKRIVLSIEKKVLEHVRANIYDRIFEMGKVVSIIDEMSSLDYTGSHYISKDTVMVVLDSNHTKEHVLKEMEIYGKLVSVGCYMVVCDTFVENRDPELYLNHECKPGNSPFDAVHEFLKTNDNFVIDTEIDRKLLISSNYNGYLKRVK